MRASDHSMTPYERCVATIEGRVPDQFPVEAHHAGPSPLPAVEPDAPVAPGGGDREAVAKDRYPGPPHVGDAAADVVQGPISFRAVHGDLVHQRLRRAADRAESKAVAFYELAQPQEIEEVPWRR